MQAARPDTAGVVNTGVAALRRRLSRFLGIGVVNTLIDVGLYAVLVPHLGIVPSTIISTGAGMLFSFVANARFAFGADRLTWKAAGQFFGLNAINLWALQPLVILGIAWVLERFIDHDYAVALLAKLGSLAVSMTINFLVYDRYIWPQKPLRPTPQPRADDN